MTSCRVGGICPGAFSPEGIKSPEKLGYTAIKLGGLGGGKNLYPLSAVSDLKVSSVSMAMRPTWEAALPGLFPFLARVVLCSGGGRGGGEGESEGMSPGV